MGVSAVGQGVSIKTLRHAAATLAVFVMMFFYFYGPPLTKAMAEAAHDQCNQRTGESYRGYVLVWRTTTYESLQVPHWTCYDLTRVGHPGTSLGWWTGI